MARVADDNAFCDLSLHRPSWLAGILLADGNNFDTLMSHMPLAVDV
jgi:hypothetical protein